MQKTLIITEKPSVAKTIAAALGINTRGQGYLENDEYVVSWCFGHLLELAPPAAYDPKYDKWRAEDLPIIPDQFRYEVRSKTKGQFKLLKQLMFRPDIGSVVNACDAGREGELICRLVYEAAGCSLPMKRLWLSSLETPAILAGMNNLKDASEYDGLFASAQCRQQADWIVGINATRLFSCVHGSVLNIGRVVTPTLKLLTDRAQEIEAFTPETYWHVVLDLDGGEARSERIGSREEAERLAQNCGDAVAVCASATREEKTASPPKLFDLTSLQREANKRFGYTAQQTLDAAQALYESKLITYPRTDSAYLPEDMEGQALKAAAAAQAAYTALRSDRPLNPAPILNGKKVTDHHAIIPTAGLAKAAAMDLSDRCRSLIGLISARLVTALLPPCRYEEAKATFTCAGREFTARGKRVLDEGFRAAESAYAATLKKKVETSEEPTSLPPYREGQEYSHPKASVTEHETSAPKPYTEASLLGAMEHAGAKETAADAERKGLGTSSTRAGILEKLVKQKFVSRKGRTLTATEAGIALISVAPEALASPRLTSEWENRLADIRDGKASAEAFMLDISSMTSDLVQTHKDAKPQAEKFRPRKESLGNCPRCGSPVYAGKANYYCSNRSCAFVMWKDDRFFTEKKLKFTPAVAKSLLKKGRHHFKKVYSVKKDKYYETDIVLADTGGKYINYKVDTASLKAAPAPKSRKART